MNKHLAAFIVSAAIITGVVFTGSTGCRNKIVHNEVTVHLQAEPGNMNPLLFNSENAITISERIYQPLVGIDHSTMRPVPVLADTFADIRTDNGKMYFTYKIKADAYWDNGDPITAKDVEFSLKLIKCPPVDDKRLKPYYEKITDFISDSKDPKRFTIVYNEPYILAEQAANEVIVFPKYALDKDNVLAKFSFKDFTNDNAELANNVEIKKYADWINTKAFENDTMSLIGSGPYTLKKHKTNNMLVLKRKEKWWGDNYNDRNDYFRAYPSSITYKIIPDPTSALAALKAGEVDVMRGLKAKQFIDLKNDKTWTDKFNLYSPQMLMFTYFGINTLNPKLNDVRVRQAISYLTDVKRIIDVVNYGMAKQIVGPILPYKKEAYNDTIVPYTINIEKAKKLLAEAGWSDTDGDGILDKVINGKRTPLTIDFIYNAGVEARRDAIRIFKEDAAKAGIDVHIIAQEANLYAQHLKGHNFEMFYSGLNPSTYPDDFKQVFHSSSINGGSNYTNYGNPDCDKLLDDIRVNLDTKKRNEEYKQLQVMLHNDAPMVFLFEITERIAVNKRYSGVTPSGLRPGYWEPGFRVTQM